MTCKNINHQNESSQNLLYTLKFSVHTSIVVMFLSELFSDCLLSCQFWLNNCEVLLSHINHIFVIVEVRLNNEFVVIKITSRSMLITIFRLQLLG